VTERPVVVLVDGERSTALLTLARRLGPPLAVVCGPPDEATVAALGRFGATTVCSVSCPEYPRYPIAARVEALAAIAGRRSPAAVLIDASRAGQEIAGRLAVRLDGGVIGDVVDVRPGAHGPIAVQATRGDSCQVESRVVRGIPVYSVRTEAVPAEPSPVEPAVIRTELAWSPSPAAARCRRPAARSNGHRPPLAGAAVVVAGGHGVGSRDGFDLVAQVADALGGAVGGSHTATELGWCPRSAQVDQTGTVVHPRLYLALGISGSVRHRAAMRHAKTVVAVDRDPAAPIFDVADLGVIGDLHEIVPALLAEIHTRQALPAPIPAPARRQT
jgi:electron transfer flavoprotein alpha subunit